MVDCGPMGGRVCKRDGSTVYSVILARSVEAVVVIESRRRCDMIPRLSIRL